MAIIGGPPPNVELPDILGIPNGEGNINGTGNSKAGWNVRHANDICSHPDNSYLSSGTFTMAPPHDATREVESLASIGSGNAP